MGLFDHFPYTNFHELNLDWILNALRELEHTIDQFVAINALKYADPIQWNIVSQYEKNTIVIDPLTGTAYISVQPVPSGVAITNTDYWTVVFDLSLFIVKAAQNFTNRWEEDTTLTATFPTTAGDWLVWGDVLYRALVNITAGDQYIVDSNIKHVTMEEVVGHLEDLTTTDKSSLVAAINEIAAEVLGKIGDLADLDTTDKSNVVAAINEVLQTLKDTCGDLADLDTTDKSNAVAAINEVLQTLKDTCGDLADLDTTDKSNLVAAINENVHRLDNFVTPEQFGASGDGVTDDKQALLDAISTGKTVYLENSYYIGSKIELASTDICIVGSGTCSLKFDDTDDMFDLDTVNIYISDVNFTVNGSGTVFKSVSTEYKFFRLKFTGSMTIVDQASSTAAVAQHSVFKDITINTTGNGIRYYGNSGSRNTTLFMENCVIHSDSLPYFIGECKYAEVYGGDFSADDASAACNLYRCDYSTINGGYYHDMYRGATIGGGTGKCGTIIGTKNTNMGFAGISVDYATNLPDPYSEGKAIVADNIIESDNYGIYIQARKMIVTGNQVYCLNTASGNKYAIRLNCNEGTQIDHGTIIEGNIINCNNSNYTYPIYLAANTLAHIRNNTFIDCAKHPAGSSSSICIWDEVLSFSESDYDNYDSIYVLNTYGIYICTSLAQNRYIFVPKYGSDDNIVDVGRTYTIINRDSTYNLTVNIKGTDTHILSSDSDNVLAPGVAARLTYIGTGYWILQKFATQQTV